jgi:hypothetical protein
MKICSRKHILLVLIIQLVRTLDFYSKAEEPLSDVFFNNNEFGYSYKKDNKGTENYVLPGRCEEWADNSVLKGSIICKIPYPWPKEEPKETGEESEESKATKEKSGKSRKKLPILYKPITKFESFNIVLRDGKLICNPIYENKPVITKESDVGNLNMISFNKVEGVESKTENPKNKSEGLIISIILCFEKTFIPIHLKNLQGEEITKLNQLVSELKTGKFSKKFVNSDLQLSDTQNDLKRKKI